MVDKCKACGAEIIQAPISKIPFWEGDTFKSRFRWEAFKKENMIWKNLFKIDWFAISYLAIILFLVWSYNFQIEEFRDISEDPCSFCANAATACSYNKNIFDIPKNVQGIDIVIDAIKTYENT